MSESVVAGTHTGFARPYQGITRNTSDLENEITELENARQGVQSEGADDIPEQNQPHSPEEVTFKKRYGDLRRHTQAKVREYEDRIKDLTRQLESATKSEMKLPRTDEEVEAWIQQYPDAAAFVQTIVAKKVSQAQQDLDRRFAEIDEREREAARQRALADVMKAHPDFTEIVQDPEFEAWAELQPKWVKHALFEQDSEAQPAIDAIDLFKLRAKRDKVVKPKSDKTDARAAASNVRVPSRTEEPRQPGDNKIYESAIQKMSAAEFEANAEAIDKARAENRFVYDVTGAARI